MSSFRCDWLEIIINRFDTRLSPNGWQAHNDDVIMSPIASQITNLTIVYSIVYSDADQRASSAENVSIGWRHHALSDAPVQRHMCMREMSCSSSSSSSNFIFQQIYNAYILTNDYTCNIIRWWLSGKCKAHLADNQLYSYFIIRCDKQFINSRDHIYTIYTCKFAMHM